MQNFLPKRKIKGFFKTGYLSYLPPLNRVNWHFLERVSARYAGVIELKIIVIDLFLNY